LAEKIACAVIGNIAICRTDFAVARIDADANLAITLATANCAHSLISTHGLEAP
jgi:hypothetical protein